MTITPKIGYTITRATKRTIGNSTNQLGKGQAHRGWKGIVRVPGQREPISCGKWQGCWHATPKGARACALATAKRIGKDKGMEVMA
jgi:hypothetical protein